MEPVSTARFTKRALVEMQEREKILSGKKKKRALAARTVYVSLDRADAISLRMFWVAHAFGF